MKMNPDLMFNMMMPGITEIAKKNGCSLKWDAYVPLIKLGEAFTAVEYDVIVDLVNNEKYETLDRYINYLCFIVKEENLRL